MKKKFQVCAVWKFPFPMDMLRYDSASYETEEDRKNAESPDSHKHTISLISKFKPTDARWRSFGWRVV
jgi:hypothetical protein